MVKYDKVTAYFTGDKEPTVVEQVSEIDHLVLKEGEDKRIAHPEDLFDEWD